MRKPAPYIILFLIVTGVAGLLLTGSNKKEKPFDQRPTLKRNDKIPYGAKIAFESLPYLFPNTTISVNKEEPGYWDSLSYYRSGQALIIISPNFNADEFEMKKIIRFIENGNDVFISAKSLSGSVEEILSVKTVFSTEVSGDEEEGMTDSLYLALANPPYAATRGFSYDGLLFSSRIILYDSSITDVLGTDELGNPNFIHLKAGKGHLYVHVAPLAFSNYFLLFRDNIRYYEQVLSVISPGVTSLVWDEYFLNKRSSFDFRPQSRSGEKPVWIKELFKHPGLKWALLVALLTLLLYVLMEMRRKQRVIPILAKPQNDSLDFVKTIGRLYYDRGDHVNLCRKMSAYFLEYVRNKYKLSTVMLDDEFVRKLQFKTGCEEKEIRDIVSFITMLRQVDKLNEKQVIGFNKNLEAFYQKA